MASWHELSRIRGSLSRYAADNKTRQVVHRSETEPDWFEAYYLRQINGGLHPPHDECTQLWPLQPLRARSPQEAVQKALVLLETAASGQHDDLFKKRPCPVPLHQKKAVEIASPTHEAKAIIYKHSETRYEVRYFVDFVGSQETGWRVGVPPLEEELPVPEGFEVLNFADSRKSAEEIAASELAQVVAGHSNLVEKKGDQFQ